MDVEEFRQICLWPLALERRQPMGGESTAETVAALARAVAEDGDWEWLADGLAHIEDDADTRSPDGKAPFSYQEFVYFHDFVARFLYARHEKGRLASTDAMPAFVLFRHRHLQAVEVEVGGYTPFGVTLHVARCNLYLFRTGVAILALEVSSKDSRCAKPVASSLPLERVLDVSDVFRRTYTPYFAFEKGAYEPAAVAAAVTWRFADGATSGPHEPASLAEEVRRLDTRDTRGDEACDPPCASAWAALLPGPLAVSGTGGAAPYRARNILDERMAVMSYLRLEADNLDGVTDAHWARLCFVDPRGDALPYDPRFLADFDARHAYDRFRHWGTRHLFSPYSYVMVTTAGEFGRHTLVHHFRRMYFQMGLLAWMEFATYIAFSSRVSRAIEAADRTREGIDGPAFRADLFQVQRDFLEFVHRFRFTGVSNQIQAGEMYARFREQLGLAPLFADVRAELETATAYLRASDSADQSVSAEGLNVVAVIGVTLGLAISLLGALPNLHGWFGDGFDRAAATTLWSALPFAGFALAALAIMQAAGEPVPRGRKRRRSVGVIRATLVVTAFLAGAVALFGFTAGLVERQAAPAGKAEAPKASQPAGEPAR